MNLTTLIEIESTQERPQFSRKKIEKAKQDCYHQTIDATVSSFLHSFVDAMITIERWDLRVGIVILNNKRKDLLEYIGDRYNKETNRVFNSIEVLFSDEVSETEVFLISEISTDNPLWTDGWVTASVKILTKEEAMIKDIIT